MAQLGCKYIVLLSRSAASNTTDGDFANCLRELGCETFIRNCDASDENSLATVLAECRQKFPPVRGIVQAAMALHVSHASPTSRQYSS
jgi:KR domain